MINFGFGFCRGSFSFFVFFCLVDIYTDGDVRFVKEQAKVKMAKVAQFFHLILLNTTTIYGSKHSRRFCHMYVGSKFL